MKILKKMLFISSMLILFCLPVFAEESSKIYYIGTINKNIKIHMMLQFQNDNVTGFYYYDIYKINIPLKGTVKLWDITINEYDSNGKISGTFIGSKVTRMSISGTWSKPDSDKKLGFQVQVDKVPNGSKIFANAKGKWEYALGHGLHGKYLEIKAPTKEGFKFSISCFMGARTGEIEGEAVYRDDYAIWEDKENDCRIKFYIVDNVISLLASESCSRYGGQGITFDGDFVREGQGKSITLTDLEVFRDKEQEEVFKKLTRKDYGLFINSFMCIAEDKDLDDLRAFVHDGWVTRLAKCYDSIVMVTPDSRIYAAIIVMNYDDDGDAVKYYTNDPKYYGHLPKTIESWYGDLGRDFKIVYVNR